MDPYKVLGLSPDASDDDVKRAYRRLAKKYHPDANPGDKVAEQKMKEINAAYDAIINHHADSFGNASSQQTNGYGGTGGYTQSDPFGGFDPFRGFYGGYTSSSWQSNDADPPRYRAAYSYIRFGRYREALNALASIPENERTARWYYYNALAHAGLGDRVAALQNAQHAVSMEPSNLEYQDLLTRLQTPGSAYTAYGRRYSVNTFGLGQYCVYLCLANFFLRLCCCGAPVQGGVFCC